MKTLEQMGADQSASAKSGREEILYQATCVRWRFEHLIDVKTIFTSWVMTWSVVYAGLPTVKKTGVEKGVPWRTVEGLLEVGGRLCTGCLQYRRETRVQP